MDVGNGCEIMMSPDMKTMGSGLSGNHACESAQDDWPWREELMPTQGHVRVM